MVRQHLEPCWDECTWSTCVAAPRSRRRGRCVLCGAGQLAAAAPKRREGAPDTFVQTLAAVDVAVAARTRVFGVLVADAYHVSLRGGSGGGGGGGVTNNTKYRPR